MKGKSYVQGSSVGFVTKTKMGTQEFLNEMLKLSKQSVVLTKDKNGKTNFKGELEFGSEHPSGAGWFFNGEELNDLWNSQKRIIIVVKERYKDKCLNVLTSPAKQVLTEGSYTILINK